ncbi:hypothetical protein K490DRAFT_62025 [Saccharata proteae CBS 121410]|uniref:Uncharacterized protein n=1 Tax=Saccharata proteae CBS 121410 TaxID=1314787 RepID=A0A9P4M0Z6_9PEZI|nr:hypothetical protein K490DRAFT_62025 [Saccharata proteae CBS 121410]
MRNGCKDISNLINVTCVPRTADVKYTTSNLTPPSGLNLTVPTEGNSMKVETASDVDYPPLSEIISLTSAPGYNDVQPEDFSTDSTGNETRMEAMALGCGLFPCVRAYRSNLTSGKNTGDLLHVRNGHICRIPLRAIRWRPNALPPRRVFGGVGCQELEVYEQAGVEGESVGVAVSWLGWGVEGEASDGG